MKTKSCTSCGAAMFFATTTDGKELPVDAQPAADGTVSVTFTDPPTAVVVGRGQAAGMRAAGIQLYRSHFATCPNADHHRNPRGAPRRR